MEENLQNVICPKCGTFNSETAIRCRTCGNELHKADLRCLPLGVELKKGDYIIKSCSGWNQDTILYKAEVRTRKIVTIKEFFPKGLAERLYMSYVVLPLNSDARSSFEERKEQFVRVGEILSASNMIPGIIRVYEVFEENGTAYWVEDEEVGKTLETLLEANGCLNFPEAVKVLEPVLETLGLLHEKGYLHRDLNPSNILLAGDRVSLTGFGNTEGITNHFAGGQDTGEGHETEGISAISAYKAPEQVWGTGAEGPWTDVYGMVAVLYKMITGTTPPAAVERIKGAEVLLSEEASIELTEKEASVIKQGLSMNINGRYKSADELLAALKNSMVEDVAEIQDSATVESENTEEGKRHNMSASDNAASEDRGLEKHPNKKTSLVSGVALGALVVLLLMVFFVIRGILPFLSDDKGKEDDSATSAQESLPEIDQSEEIPATVKLKIHLLDSRGEALRNYNVHVTQDFENGDSILIFSGKSDVDGWLETVELTDIKSYIEIAIQETGEGLYYSMDEIHSCNGTMELYYSFHLYSETYVFGGHTYAVGTLRDSYGLETYDDVKAYCEGLGGHLAVINNAEEDAFLYDLACIPGVSTAFFGYTDQSSEGDWTWAFGSSSYTNWTRPGSVHPGPDNGNGPSGWGPENYAEYNSGDDGANNGTWNDAKFAVNTDTFIIEWEFEKP